MAAHECCAGHLDLQQRVGEHPELRHGWAPDGDQHAGGGKPGRGDKGGDKGTEGINRRGLPGRPSGDLQLQPWHGVGDHVHNREHSAYRRQ